MVKKPVAVTVGGIRMKNPVMSASGTFGYGTEMNEYTDISCLGAIVTKTITVKPRPGNQTPRIVETPSGMLNSIGLENKGLEDFTRNKASGLKKIKTNVIVSISGESADEFARLAEEISSLGFVKGIEANLSCPNISHGKLSGAKKLVAQDPGATEKIIKTVRKHTKLSLIAKLTPNVTDIKEIARAAEAAGADAVAAINTVFGMSVNPVTKKARLANITGGLSGPAVKPIALYFVREIFSAVKIPVIGLGGIMTAEDALEFILCGAAAVQVGTATFVEPDTCSSIVKGLEGYVKKHKVKNISSLTGALVI